MTMKLINGTMRADLENMLKQLQDHGDGGGSSDLGKAFDKFGVFNEHQLCKVLLKMLLSLEITQSGGGGGPYTPTIKSDVSPHSCGMC